MNQHQEKAVRLLDHYLTLLMEKQGLKVDSDIHVEIAECVEHVVNASVEETMRRLKELSVNDPRR